MDTLTTYVGARGGEKRDGSLPTYDADRLSHLKRASARLALEPCPEVA